jgi:signal peptidase II
MSVRRRLLLAAIVLLTIALDQQSKRMARAELLASAPRQYGVLTLLYAENAGAFLSLGANLPAHVRHLLFDGLVSAGLIAAAFVLFTGRMQPGPDDIAIAFILGGGAGNLIDRFRFDGHVTDFLYLQAGRLHTGIFNIADVAITAGVLWLALAWIVAPLFRRRAPAVDAAEDR